MKKQTYSPRPENRALDASIQSLSEALQRVLSALGSNDGTRGESTPRPTPNRRDTPLGSVVISGVGLGLPGVEKDVMDPDNAQRILRGESFLEPLPERFLTRMMAKNITQPEQENSTPAETNGSPAPTALHAGRPGRFNLAEEYGVPPGFAQNLDITAQLAFAAGLDALREAGIPLVQTYRETAVGKWVNGPWQLPTALRDETGVIFASALPGGERLVAELKRYFDWESRRQQLYQLEGVARWTDDPHALGELNRRMDFLRQQLTQEPYTFDSQFLNGLLSAAHSQFAAYIGARGPNTHLNASGASVTQAIALAEDWIRSGRCRRVIVISAEAFTGDTLVEWIGAGLLASQPAAQSGAAATIGMGASALVVESEDAVRERGMRAIVEVLDAESLSCPTSTNELDSVTLARAIDEVVTTAECRWGLHRQAMASQLVYLAQAAGETPGSFHTSPEARALRQVFGEAAGTIVIASTQAQTGPTLGASVEDAVAVKILEYGVVPPFPQINEQDPALVSFNLSRGGRYPVQFALRVETGFGVEMAASLLRRIPGSQNRTADPERYQYWVEDVSGWSFAELEVVKRVLRVQAKLPPQRSPSASRWLKGSVPTLRAAAPGAGLQPLQKAPRMTMTPVPALAAAAPHQPKPADRPAHSSPPAPNPEMDEIISISIPNENESGSAAMSFSTPGLLQDDPPIFLPPVEGPARLVSSSEPTRPDSRLRPVIQQVFELVAAKSNTDRDQINLHTDLNRDLGLDAIQQAELILEIHDRFQIAKQDHLRLQDFRTVGQFVNHVIVNQA